MNDESVGMQKEAFVPGKCYATVGPTIPAILK